MKNRDARDLQGLSFSVFFSVFSIDTTVEEAYAKKFVFHVQQI